METKFYEFSQNNSGGYFDTNENVCHRVVIEATSEKEAKNIFSPMIEDQSGSYPCCGERWSMNSDEINIEDYKNKGYPAKIYTHYTDYEARWLAMFGNFKRIEEPKIEQKAWGKEYGTNVFFKDIEDYCRFMANSYGQTSPDVRIHYLDGRKSEFFKSTI